MHERSIARRLAEQMIRIAQQHKASSVDEAVVRVGEFSGIEPTLLASALSEWTESSLLSCARLSIEISPLEAVCQACGTRFRVEAFRFVCGCCRSNQVKIVQGEELTLETVSLSLPADYLP